MWNFGGSYFVPPTPVTSITPRITCTNTVSSAAIRNHHIARVRNASHLWAARNHRPDSPFETMTNQANPWWMSRSTGEQSAAGFRVDHRLVAPQLAVHPDGWLALATFGLGRLRPVTVPERRRA